MAREWLGRAGSLPLFIQIYRDLRSTSSRASNFEFLYPLCDLIKAYSGRWRSLELRTVPRSLLRRLLVNLYDSPVPCLHYLCLEQSNFKADRADEHPLDLMTLSPNTFHSNIPHSSFSIQWQALAHLTLTSPYPIRKFLSILLEARQIIQCNAQLSTIEEPSKSYDDDDEDLPGLKDLPEGFPSEQNPLSCGAMKELRLHFDELVDDSNEDGPPHYLFTRIVTPELERLQIYYPEQAYFDSSLADPISTLILRSKCSLKCFNLQGVRFCHESEDQLVRILELMPSVENLNIFVDSNDDNDGGLTDHFFHQASLDHGHCPILEELKKFEYNGPRNFSWERFSDFFCIGTTEGSQERSRVLKMIAVSLAKRDEGLMDERTMWRLWYANSWCRVFDCDDSSVSLIAKYRHADEEERACLRMVYIRYIPDWLLEEYGDN